MDRREKAGELLAQAERAGLRLEFDSGLNLVKRMESGDPDRQRAIIAELTKYLPEIRRAIEGRAIAARATKFVGQRVWSENGPGTLIRGSHDGVLTISTGAEVRGPHEEEAHRSQITIGCNAKDLFIVADGEDVDGASSPDDGPKSKQPKPGFLDRFRGSGKG
ncbi:MAG: hypothetical protein ACLP1Y_01120 [Candidatus Acidiferrales bacterium]